MASVAPMDVFAEITSIPLKCVLCPKQPSFSDISHLLTHISSKSHLSYRFKTEIRSQNDREAQLSLAHFDDWYRRYGIQNLLAERMNAKDQKKTSKRSRTSGDSTKTIIPTKGIEIIKPDPDTDEDYPVPPIAHWSAGVNGKSLRARAGGRISLAGYHTPLLGDMQDPFSNFGSPEGFAQPSYKRWPSETETTESVLPSSETTIGEDDNDCSKLKGVLWPGMSLFDSATEDQKRKRNQRKDESVLKQMELTSAGVEPTESIFTEDIEFQRTRDIYATPSVHGSPEPEAEVTQKHKSKKARRTKPTASATKRQTRSATRKARAKLSIQIKNDDEDETEEDTSVKQESQSTNVSLHTHETNDNFDIFRDPSPAARTDSPRMDATSMPALRRTQTTPIHQLGNRQLRRPALQQMSVNSIPTAIPNSLKQVSAQYFQARDATHSPFSAHASTASHPFFQHQPGLISNTFNPLSLQARGVFPYNPFTGQNFGGDSQPRTTNGFQAINSMTSGAYNPFALSGGHNSYSSSAPAGHQDSADNDA